MSSSCRFRASQKCRKHCNCWKNPGDHGRYRRMLHQPSALCLRHDQSLRNHPQVHPNHSVHWEAFASLHPSVVQSPCHGEPHPCFKGGGFMSGRRKSWAKWFLRLLCCAFKLPLVAVTTDLRIAKSCFTFWKKTFAMNNVVSETHLILDMFHKSLKRGKSPCSMRLQFVRIRRFTSCSLWKNQSLGLSGFCKWYKSGLNLSQWMAVNEIYESTGVPQTSSDQHKPVLVNTLQDQIIL